MAAPKLLSVDFEVFGKVQGVFFRKYTVSEGNKLGLRGWCMNTPKGTVQGQMEGEPVKIEQMKNWLQQAGSPESRIDRAQFSKQKEIEEFSFNGFVVRH